MKLLFVMFPGIGVPKKGWDTYFDDNNKKVKHNFISELKKLGDLYFHDPPYHNVRHYIDKNKYKYKYLYKKDLNFTKDDMDVDTICEQIYNDVKDFDGKLVLVGHSIGSYFVYYFSQKYHKKCLFNVIIDGSPLGPIEQTLDDKKELYPEIKKYTKYTNEDIKDITNKILEGNQKSIKEILDMAINNIFSYKKIMNKAKKFKIPTLCFYDFRLLEKDDAKTKKIFTYFNIRRTKEIEHFMKYNNDYKSITFVNKGHFPHHVSEAREVILENIKLMIEKYI